MLTIAHPRLGSGPSAVETYLELHLHPLSPAESDELVAYLLTIKRSEWSRFLTAVTDWEQREYGSLF